MNYQMAVENTKPSVTGDQSLAARPHVLVIDDDDRIRDLVARYLTEHGFVVATTSGAAEARQALEAFTFDVLVVDVMMPGETGLDFTRDLRTRSDIPVLLLTALGETDDRIAGLESGADDYLPKPFEPREMVLRLQAILRRRPKPQDLKKPVRIGRWVYDPAGNTLIDGAETQRLTTTEISLLNALVLKAGQVISRDDLARMCDMDDSGERTIDVQITRLRRKIEEDSRMPRYLQTVRGKGYLLRVETV
jgi:two-component system phosphate regulon response regulator OmpR